MLTATQSGAFCPVTWRVQLQLRWCICTAGSGRSTGLGLSVAILFAFNPNLSRMQEATPATLGLCGVLSALLAYGWHERVTAESSDLRSEAQPLHSGHLVGGLSLGVTLFVVGRVGTDRFPDHSTSSVLSAAFSGSSTPSHQQRGLASAKPGVNPGLLADGLSRTWLSHSDITALVPSRWLNRTVGK